VNDAAAGHEAEISHHRSLRSRPSHIVIGILDTGVDSSHPALSDRMVPGASFVTGAPDAQDDNGHGTGMAGVAAATAEMANELGGIRCGGKIMPVKVANYAGRTEDQQVAVGIRWAVDHGARVLNLSLGTRDIPEMRDAVLYAHSHDVVVVAASPGKYSAFPAPAMYPRVIAVGGSGNRDQPLNFGGHLAENLILAPAEDVLTTSRGGGYGNFLTSVSVATPHVAGVAALLLLLRPDLTADQVMTAIREGADLVTGQTGFDYVHGWGRLNAYRSLQIAQALPMATWD